MILMSARVTPVLLLIISRTLSTAWFPFEKEVKPLFKSRHLFSGSDVLLKAATISNTFFLKVDH